MPPIRRLVRLVPIPEVDLLTLSSVLFDPDVSPLEVAGIIGLKRHNKIVRCCRTKLLSIFGLSARAMTAWEFVNHQSRSGFLNRQA